MFMAKTTTLTVGLKRETNSSLLSLCPSFPRLFHCHFSSIHQMPPDFPSFPHHPACPTHLHTCSHFPHLLRPSRPPFHLHLIPSSVSQFIYRPVPFIPCQTFKVAKYLMPFLQSVRTPVPILVPESIVAYMLTCLPTWTCL